MMIKESVLQPVLNIFYLVTVGKFSIVIS